VKLTRTPLAVIFDLDGVLLDTEPLYTLATQRVVEKHGKVYDWSIKGRVMGRGEHEAAAFVVDALALPISPDEYLRQWRPTVEALLRDAPEFPGARSFVAELQAIGLPLAVASSSDTRLFELKTARLSWFAAFSAVILVDHPDVHRPKPAPDIFLVAAAALGVAPASCVVIEDSPAGVAGAKAAGMQVIAMPDPAMDRARYAAADAIIAGYADLRPSDLGL
jgi:pseudouridine-5'-monophosphatase